MKTTRIIIFAICLVMLFALTGCNAFRRDVHHEIGEYVLEYDIGDKESFRILQLSDVHLANKDDRQRQYDFLGQTVEMANPDMIVVSGDMFTFADKRTAKEWFAFLDSFGKPWTVTFGNHDEQCYFSVDWLTGYLNSLTESEQSHCLFKDIQDDDVYGNANFAIDLKRNGEIYQQVIIMDSNRYNYGEYIGYDFIKDDQIEWYKSLVNHTTEKYGKVVPSLMYFHIPLTEWNEAVEMLYTNRPDETSTGEGVYVDEDNHWVHGDMWEGISSPVDHPGFFSEITKLGSTKAISVGHDHANNLVLKYKGVYLCYGVNSTDRIYFEEGVGDEKLNGKPLIGGRVLIINSDMSYGFEDVIHEYDK